MPACTPTGGSHYFNTPQAGAKVDKHNVTEVGRALRQLGIEHIAAYSPEARGRSERAFQTHQGRLPQELARAGIADMGRANRYLEQIYRASHNREFSVAATLEGTAYVPFISGSLPDILCEQHERTVGNDNCVSSASSRPDDGRVCLQELHSVEGGLAPRSETR